MGVVLRLDVHSSVHELSVSCQGFTAGQSRVRLSKSDHGTSWEVTSIVCRLWTKVHMVVKGDSMVTASCQRPNSRAEKYNSRR